MALITRRNPDTDELECYWDPNFKLEKAISDEAFEAGRRLRHLSVDNRVCMAHIADELGVTSVDVSNTFRGLHEITPEMEAKCRAAIQRAKEKRDELH